MLVDTISRNAVVFIHAANMTCAFFLLCIVMVTKINHSVKHLANPAENYFRMVIWKQKFMCACNCIFLIMSVVDHVA